MEPKLKRICSIDYVKYLCAIIVVFLHVVNIMSFQDGTTAENSRKAILFVGGFISPVEVFFVFSAYLFFKKSPDFHALVRFVKRLYLLFMLYAILYIPLFVHGFQGKSLVRCVLSLIKQIFFVGYSYHGWFVPALAFGMVFVWLLVEFMKGGGGDTGERAFRISLLRAPQL